MITKTISNKFYGEGLEINPSINEDIRKLDYNLIVKLFEKSGLILFRDFEIKSSEIVKLTDLYTENYANDALRRKSRMEQKEVRNVDYGNEEMALHSEASFSPNWPEIIWFFCNEFNTNGRGTTTLCDGIKLWDNLSYETKNFFLLNPIKYKLKIPIGEKKIGKKTKKWFLNYQGAGDGLLDLSNGLLNITQIRFAAHPSRLHNKMCFSNHTLYKDTDPTIIEWGTIDDNKIPQNILDETNKKSKEITYDLKWKKNDLVMIDNKRFMHGRRSFKKSDKRDLLVVQSSLANFGYGSTTRKKIKNNKLN